MFGIAALCTSLARNARQTKKHGGQARSFTVSVLRQDGPGQPSYWERHKVDYVPDMNVISVLQTIAAQAKDAEGHMVAPVAWEVPEVSEVLAAWVVPEE